MFNTTKKNFYQLIKLYKIVDYKEALEIDAELVISQCLTFFTDNYQFYFNDYSINFGHRNFKNINRFKEFLKHSKEIVDLSCAQNNKRLGYSNFLLNLTSNIPEFGVVEITLAIESDQFIHLRTQKFIEQLNNDLSLDYGYIRYLSDNYEPLTESKIKKGLFGGYSLTQDENESVWNAHLYGIKMGYLKDIYSVNFLNSAQMQNAFISSFQQQSIGTFTRFSENLFAWELTEKEIQEAKSQVKNSEYLIGSKQNYQIFLNSPEAEKIKKKTYIDLQLT